MTEESRLINVLSDTVSEKWADLLAYIKHQAGRDWGNQPHYASFYDALRKYLETELRQRIKTEFSLVDEGLSRKEEREAVEWWAERLAPEFVQHLVAEAQLRKK